MQQATIEKKDVPRMILETMHDVEGVKRRKPFAKSSFSVVIVSERPIKYMTEELDATHPDKPFLRNMHELTPGKIETVSFEILEELVNRQFQEKRVFNAEVSRLMRNPPHLTRDQAEAHARKSHPNIFEIEVLDEKDLSRREDLPLEKTVTFDAEEAAESQEPQEKPKGRKGGKIKNRD